MQNTNTFICEFCKKNFKYKSTLETHKKTAKFCLKIQDKPEEFICAYCNSKLKTKRNLLNHLEICKEKIIEDKLILVNETHKSQIEKLQNIINEQKIIIATLKGKIEIYEKDHDVISDIAKQTKITNTINNLAFYDVNKITENFSNKLDYITKEDIINGQKGIANILAPCLLDDNKNKMLTCTDKSR